MLPRRNGIEVLTTLRKRGLQTPVLSLTAKDAVEDRVHGLDSGADDYLVKPFAIVWHGLCGIGSWGAVSENGRLRRGAGGHPRGDRRRRGLVCPSLSSSSRSTLADRGESRSDSRIPTSIPTGFSEKVTL